MGLRADKADLKLLQISFNSIDQNNDGKLSVDEIKQAEKETKQFKLGAKWEDVLKECDLNGDGFIDFNEFFACAVSHQKIATEKNIKYAFDQFDENGDGQIDVNEFNIALPTNAKGNVNRAFQREGSVYSQKDQE